MKYGIYYAYWAREWGADYRPYIEKVKRLGFDILEISCAGLIDTPDEVMIELGQLAKENSVTLTSGYGPAKEYDIGAENPDDVARALDFYDKTFRKLQLADIHYIGGAIYSYWPIDYSQPFDKAAIRARSIQGMKKLGALAAKYDITIGLEVLNRFENFLLNTAEEGIAFAKEVNCPNVKIMLDTFHMNIEEDSLGDAIRSVGKDLLCQIHVGECNRRVPGQGRMDWDEIAQALHDIDYDGNVVMEPFVLDGGQVGLDIKIFRDMSHGASEEDLDRDAAESVAFLRKKFER